MVSRQRNPIGRAQTRETITIYSALLLRFPLFFFLQNFDKEKYRHIRPELHNNNNRTTDKDKTLVGLRIDDKGGIYLQPLIDTNTAYFK